jgi:hypothetical protein
VRDSTGRSHRTNGRSSGHHALCSASVTGLSQTAAMGAQTVGYMTFETADECKAYFRNILSNYSRRQDTNAYEFHNILALIEQGHPNAAEKLAGEVRAIQIRERRVDGQGSACFHLIKADGRVEDVSYLKCVVGLFGPDALGDDS